MQNVNVLFSKNALLFYVQLFSLPFFSGCNNLFPYCVRNATAKLELQFTYYISDWQYLYIFNNLLTTSEKYLKSSLLHDQLLDAQLLIIA